MGAANAFAAYDRPEILHDASESRALKGRADAVVFPATADEVAETLAWCFERGVPVVPRGGGTGYAGGAVPLDGGVVLGLSRLNRIREFDPLLWRIFAEAGLTTAELRRTARESGLYFPPDPGAAEQSQIGGNVATNAGGPHAFKYGTTGAWVTGLEVVVPPGELITLGGPLRKDVAAYDLRSLLVGSEGTLGIVTAVWLRLIPAPAASYPVAAWYPDAEVGCEAIGRVLGYGLQPAILEYFDEPAMELLSGNFPAAGPPQPGFMLLAEADGGADEAERLRAELVDALGETATFVHSPTAAPEIAALWRWREGVSFAVAAKRGGKVGEDIVVPLDRVEEAIAGTIEIGRRHGLDACSWGHAGDGNLHSNFLVDVNVPDELDRARRASEDIFSLALDLGGSISGEHGVGWLKRGQLERQLQPQALALHTAIKRAFDPRGLLNPGKKV